MAKNIPEHSKPAELFYNKEESKKYHRNTRINKIQIEMTEKALELLNLNDRKYFIIDIGCGSGLSSQVILDKGHEYIGVDISESMLNIHREFIENSNILNFDIGEKEWPLTENSFDFAISISTIQWLFSSFKNEHNPKKRINNFLNNLYRITKYKAVLQFYLKRQQDIDMLVRYSKKVGFYTKLIIDGVGKNKKFYIIISKLRK
ncbi:WBS22 [Hepatospora eriocheir]|uniref:WBS22 n=1 Tax=Hepatospora eriocheir TaxID=1081669 RepID=A0A1X0QKC9_9MICR|nr:WBS22 [Hepatospora eriocheir]